MSDLYAIAYYNSNVATPNCAYLNTLNNTLSQENTTQDEPIDLSQTLCFVSPDDAFVTFSDLKEAKKYYHSLLNILRKNGQRFSPSVSIEDYASFYNIINLNTHEGLKISIKSFKEFCQRAVYTYGDYLDDLNLNEKNFRGSLFDIMWKLQHHKKEEYLNFRFQSLTQFKEIKEKELPNDSIYYSFKQDNPLKSPYLIYVNENENKQYVINIDFDMINNNYRVLD